MLPQAEEHCRFQSFLFLIYALLMFRWWAWGGTVVKVLCYYSGGGVGHRDFSRGYRQNHVPWGSTQPLKKWVPGIPLGVKAAGAWGWRPTTLVVPNVKKSGALTYPDPLGPSRRPVVGETFTFTFIYIFIYLYLDIYIHIFIYTYSTNIPPIMIINRTWKSKSSVAVVVSFLVRLRTYQHRCSIRFL